MISLRLLNPDASTLKRYGVNGAVYLEIEEESFKLRLTKALDEFSEVDAIRQEAAIPQSLPYTALNLSALQQYKGFLLNNESTSVGIELKIGGQTTGIDRLDVIRFNDRTQLIEVEIFGQGWLNDLENLTLNSLDLGTYEYTSANVLATWADPQALAYPLLAHYGGFIDAGEVGRKDLRFIFNLYKLMKAAFCAIGYQLESTYYETIGSQVAGYLSPERWYTYRDKNDPRRVELNFSAPRVISGPAGPVVMDEISDPLNLYNNVLLRPGEYIYNANPEDEPGGILVKVRLKVELEEAFTTRGTFSILIYRNRVTAGPVSNIDFVLLETIEGPGVGEGSRTYEVEYSIEYEDIGTADSYGVYMGYTNETSDFLIANVLEAEVSFGPNPPFYIEDDIITLADLIDPELNALDLFKDMAKLINGKIVSDPVNRIVKLLPPYDTEQLSEAMAGFFERDNEPILLPGKVEEKSAIQEYTATKQARYIKLKFADARDAYINEFTNQEEPYARLIDLGQGENQTDDIYGLDLFEPTLEVKTTAAEVGSGIANDTPFLPALWDNTEGRPSTKIGPRLLYVYGLVKQIQGDGNFYQVNFEGATRSALGYASQNPTRPRTVAPDAVRLIFREDQNDLYRLFYRRYLNEFRSAVTYDLLLNITYLDYLQINFRRPLGLYYGGVYYVFQVLNIRDFDVSGTLSTPVKLNLINC
jgi:hypothetical protein